MEASSYFKVVRNRIGIIFLTMLVTVVVVAVGTLQTPRLYEASTKLRIMPYGVNSPDYGAFVYFDRLVNTYTNILNSETLTNEAEQQLGLEELPDYTVALIPQTEIMQITVQADSAERAALVANTLAQLLIEHNSTSYISDDNELRTLLRGRLEELRVQIGNLISERNAVIQNRWLFSERLADIEQELASLGQAYNNVLNTYNQAVVSQSVMASAISIMEPATAPKEPLPSYTSRNLILAGIAGLTGGMLLAFMVESRNPQFYSNRQIEAITRIPIIGRIPHLGRRFRRNVFEGDRLGMEAFRRLRTHVLTRAKNEPLRSLVVTSAAKGEGKTTIAANLAAAMAYSGLRVLLVDANLTPVKGTADSRTVKMPKLPPVANRHKPRPTAERVVRSVASATQKSSQAVKVYNRTELENLEQQHRSTVGQRQSTARNNGNGHQPGLTQLLQDRVTVREAIQDTEIPNLRMMLSGEGAVNSAELLSSGDFHDLIKRLLPDYDLIVFDTPAVMTTADAQIIARQTDGVLWVINPAVSGQKAAAYTRDQLQDVGANMVGIVVNNVGSKDLFEVSNLIETLPVTPRYYPSPSLYEGNPPPRYQPANPQAVTPNGTDKHLVD
ncbi:MAG: AAA family ATPase [Chloroflexi bacterium]|nr:AAA family ATPase [Chloroflexota bacterium]